MLPAWGLYALQSFIGISKGYSGWITLFVLCL